LFNNYTLNIALVQRKLRIRKKWTAISMLPQALETRCSSRERNIMYSTTPPFRPKKERHIGDHLILLNEFYNW